MCPCHAIVRRFVCDSTTKPDIPDIAGIKVTVIRGINTPRNIYGFITLNTSRDKAHNMDAISINIQITITILFKARVIITQNNRITAKSTGCSYTQSTIQLTTR